MNYTREIVLTVNGYRKVMTGEMRSLMKKGIERHLVPASEFKGPHLKLDSESKAEIKTLQNSIHRCKKQLYKLECKKSELNVSPSKIRDIEVEMEKLQFDIFECQTKIRDIKKACYKNFTRRKNKA